MRQCCSRVSVDDSVPLHAMLALTFMFSNTHGPRYEMSLTLSGPAEDDPWRLLSVDVLVGAARSAGSDGAGGPRDGGLVSPDQIPLLHHMVQTSMSADAAQPLHAACTALRGFCLTLRLLELTDETQRHVVPRWGARIRVAVSANQHLHVSYWTGLVPSSSSSSLPSSTTAPPPTLKLTLVKEAPSSLPGGKGPANGCSLRVTHEPELVDPDTGKVVLFSAVRDGVDAMLTAAVAHSSRARLAAVAEALTRSGLLPGAIC